MNIVIGVIAIIVGLGVLAVGRRNAATGAATESGSRRLTNRAVGQSSDYTGTKASATGWARMLAGAGLVIFGIVFMVAA